MNSFPAKARLQYIVTALLKQMPHQFGVMLEADRFKEAANAIQRFSDPLYLQQALSQVNESEAEYLADLIQSRWARIGDVILEPTVAIIAPEQIWLGNKDKTLKLQIATIGIDGEWQAEWLGGVNMSEDSKSADITLSPPLDENPCSKEIAIKVTARYQGKRCLLVAKHRVSIRQPRLAISDNRRMIKISDHCGEAAAEVRVDIDGQVYSTQKNGLLELPQALSDLSIVHVADVKVSLNRDIKNQAVIYD